MFPGQQRLDLLNRLRDGELGEQAAQVRIGFKLVGQRHAVQIVSTARANGLEPYEYMRRLFEELPKAKIVEDFEALLRFNAMPT
jgi:hypothetical protein